MSPCEIDENEFENPFLNTGKQPDYVFIQMDPLRPMLKYRNYSMKTTIAANRLEAKSQGAEENNEELFRTQENMG